MIALSFFFQINAVADHAVGARTGTKVNSPIEGKQNSNLAEMPCTRTRKEEKLFIEKIMCQTINLAKSQLSGVGKGWSGNLFRTGPHCDKVFFQVQKPLDAALFAYSQRQQGLCHFQINSALTKSNFFLDHIFFALVDKKTDKATGFWDPWSTGNCKLITVEENARRVDEMSPISAKNLDPVMNPHKCTENDEGAFCYSQAEAQRFCQSNPGGKYTWCASPSSPCLASSHGEMKTCSPSK